jgi:3-deoxy-D-manno-octulosonic-acid transferase
MGLIRFAYNLAFPVVLIAMLPALVWRMIRRGKYRHKFGQRFGLYSRRVRERLRGTRRTWVHAVSVGEVLIAVKLIRKLREREPDRCFVLSTTTSTGFAIASEQRADWLEPIYNPLDFFLFTRRALALIRPEQLILVEAEVWPNLVAQARARGAACLLVNARLSPRSEARFRAFRAITAPVFNQLDAICVQDAEDVDRWERLGVARGRLVRTGSIKFDDALDNAAPPRDLRPLLAQIGVGADAPVFIGASTHRGEEALLGGLLRDLREAIPGLFFIAVPRHVERAAEVRAELEALGLRVLPRSELDSAAVRPDVLLVDTTGELRHWYASADVVFVGKSLLAAGGQNPAEPITAGRAVIVGPQMQNFELLTRRLVENGGVAQVSSAGELRATLARLLRAPAERADLIARGQAVIASHRGATDRTCDVIGRLRRPAANF